MKFKPGIYQHWKGPLYRALFLAQDSTNYDLGDGDGKKESTELPLVVYVSLERGTLCVRSLEQWEEVVRKNDGAPVPRFKWVRR